MYFSDHSLNAHDMGTAFLAEHISVKTLLAGISAMHNNRAGEDASRLDGSVVNVVR